MPVDNSNYTEGLNDLIGNPPGWLLRSGLTILGIVVILAFIITSFIRYPDKLSSTGIMTSTTPPITHHAQTLGLVDTIYVGTDEHVTPGDTLLYIRNEVKRSDMAALIRFFDQIEETEHFYSYEEILFPKSLKLGELQSEYAALELAFEELVMAFDSKEVLHRINALKREKSTTLIQKELTLQKKEISEEELKLIETDFNRTKFLFDQNLISDLEYDKAKTTLLQGKKQFLSLEMDIVNTVLREE